MHEVLIDELNKQIYVAIPAAHRASFYKRADSQNKGADYSSLDRKKGSKSN